MAARYRKKAVRMTEVTSGSKKGPSIFPAVNRVAAAFVSWYGLHSIHFPRSDVRIVRRILNNSVKAATNPLLFKKLLRKTVSVIKNNIHMK
ncbi:hypothetical protein D3C80_1923910 [compost metagenome]